MRFYKKYLKETKGAALIEYAFGFPIFLLFIFGIIEMGFLFWGKSSLNYATSYAARQAFVFPQSSEGDIESFALSKIDLLKTSFSFIVTKTPNVQVEIEGQFDHSFLFIPLDPLILETKVTQPLPTP